METSKKPAKVPKSLQIPWPIRATAKLLASVSTPLATAFCARLFTTPLKHRPPRRELGMEAESRKERIHVPAIGKDIVLYRYGEGNRKVLLVHGWSGRGTQLVKIADAYRKKGYEVISFDAPAHGRSPGSTTLMPEFIASIFEVEKLAGPFDTVVGHSLGGMSVLNALKDGLQVRSAAIVGSGDVIGDIFDGFIRRMELNRKISLEMKRYFERRYPGKTMEDYSSYLSAKAIDIPVLVIHDQDDHEVPVGCAYHIADHLKNGKLMITEGLGHRKILGDAAVIASILNHTL